MDMSIGNMIAEELRGQFADALTAGQSYEYTKRDARMFTVITTADNILNALRDFGFNVDVGGEKETRLLAVLCANIDAGVNTTINVMSALDGALIDVQAKGVSVRMEMSDEEREEFGA